MKLLLLALLLSALPGLFHGDTQWYASHSSLLLRELLAAAVIYRLSRYHPAALFWMVLCSWDVAMIPLWLYAPHVHSAINWIVWPFAFTLALWHITTRTATTLRPNRCYLALRRPHTVQGWLLAAVGFPAGSCRIMTFDYNYRYHNGFLMRQSTAAHHKYVIIPLTATIPPQLDASVGEKWTWRSNCLTLIMRVKLWTQ